MVKNFEATSSAFTWLGKGQVKNRRKPDQLHYESFEHEGFIVKTKDYVLIRNDDYSNSESLYNCYIAQVEDLFDTGDEREDRYRAVVQWYMHIDELPPKVQKMLLEPDYKREVVKSTSKRFGNVIDAETIFGKCTIITLPPDVPSYLMWDMYDSKGLPMFCCRWHYDGQSLSPADGHDQESNRLTKLKDKTSKSTSKYKEASDYESLDDDDDDDALAKKTCYETPRQKRDGKLSFTTRTRLCSASKASHKQDRTLSVKSSKNSKRKLQAQTDPTHKNKVSRNLEKSFNNIFSDKPEPETDEKDEKDWIPTKHSRHIGRTKLQSSAKEKPKLRKRIIFEDSSSQSEDDSDRKITTRRTPVKPRKGQLVKFVAFSDESDSDDIYIPGSSSETSSSDEDQDPTYTEKNEYNASRNKIRAVPQSTCKKPQSKANSNKTPTTRTPRRKKFTDIKRIPSRTIPRSALTPLAEARARLHVSAVPDRLPCREQEFEHIYSFVKGKLDDGTGGCMYISGVPGTGKTATVRSVIHTLEVTREEEGEVDFKYIEINGMKVTDPHQCYIHLVREVTGERVSSVTQAENILDKEFSSSHRRETPVVLMVDELDLLCTPKQKVLYNLFDWPTRPHSKLIVLAIANTMNLLERVMMNRISSRLGLTRVTFVPYNHKQLQEIIMSRLQGLKAFDPDAVLLVARKVAAPLSGDVRRALNICRRAAEIAEEEVNSPSKKFCLVTMAHIEKALDEILGSLHIKLIQCASKHEKIFLRGILADFKETGLEETTFSRAFRQHHILCRIEGIPPLNTAEVASIYNRLSSCGLLSANSGSRSDFKKVYLRANIDDVNYALNSSN